MSSLGMSMPQATAADGTYEVEMDADFDGRFDDDEGSDDDDDDKKKNM